MAKIFDAGEHIFRIDRIVYLAKEDSENIKYYLEGVTLSFVLHCDSTEQRDTIYEYIKNEIINN